VGHDKHHVVLSSLIVDTTAKYLLELSAKHLFLRERKDRRAEKIARRSVLSQSRWWINGDIRI